MKQAKASKAEWQRLVDWLNGEEESGRHPPPWHRVVFGYDLLVEHCADPAKDYLDFKPGTSPDEIAALRNGLRELLAELKREDSDWVGPWEDLEKFDELAKEPTP